jgi:hypothetical protein
VSPTANVNGVWLLKAGTPWAPKKLGPFIVMALAFKVDAAVTVVARAS